MKAKILPLNGKYYGTEIDIDTEKNYPENETGIKLWYCGNYNPSDRELANHKITRREWESNKLDKPREDGWGDYSTDPKDFFEICDSHFESQDCYELAKFICNAINSAEKKDKEQI